MTEISATSILDLNKLEVISSFFEGLTPQKKLDIVTFASKYIDLPEENNPFPGLYDIDRTPHYRQLFKDLQDPDVEEVIVMKGFQIGLTLVAIIYVLWRMVYEPTSILFVQPTESDAKKFVQDKLKPMFAACEPLQKKISELTNKKGKDQDTLHRIKFPGGILNVGHAHSPNSLRSITVEVLVRDENSSYPVNVKGQGDPNFISWGRTAGYKQTRKILTFSTPAQGLTCRITNLSNDRYTEKHDSVFYPCPDKNCDGESKFVWEQLRWDEETPDEVNMICVKCTKEFSEETWKSQYGKFIYKKLNETKLKRTKKAYFYSCLYAPYGGFSWGDAVSLFEKSKTDKANKIAFTNNVLGKPYFDKSDSLEHDYLYSRCEKYKTRPLPKGIDLVTAGVDINGDFVAIEIVGWTYGFGSYSLDYIHLKKASPYDPETWKRLYKILKRTYLHSSGTRISISCSAIDAGHAAQEVYDFVRGKESENIIAVRGISGAHKPILGNPTTNNLGNIPLYSVGQETVSSTVFARLKVDTAAEPGYCRIPLSYKTASGRVKHKQQYFKEMTSEHCLINYRKGYAKLEWCKKDDNARNEAFDCRKYATAAVYYFDFHDFDQFLDEIHGRNEFVKESRGYRSEVS